MIVQALGAMPLTSYRGASPRRCLPSLGSRGA